MKVCIYSVCTVFVYILMYGYILYGHVHTICLYMHCTECILSEKRNLFFLFSFLFFGNEVAISRQVSLEALFCTDLTYGVWDVWCITITLPHTLSLHPFSHWLGHFVIVSRWQSNVCIYLYIIYVRNITIFLSNFHLHGCWFLQLGVFSAPVYACVCVCVCRLALSCRWIRL